MKAQLEQFFKHHRNLTISMVLFTALILVFVMPKIYFSLNSSDKFAYWVSFLISFGTIMFVFFGKKSKKEALSQKTESFSVSKSYQDLLDEVQQCSKELRQHRVWAYCCLIMGLMFLWIGQWIDHPPYNHPTFAIPVFALALLGSTRSLERENELDKCVVECTLKGIELEEKQPDQSTVFSYPSIPSWSINLGSSIAFGITALFLTKLACNSYCKFFKKEK